MRATITIPPGYSLLKPRTLKRRGDLIFMMGSDSCGRPNLSWEEVMVLGPVTGGAMVIRPLPKGRASQVTPLTRPLVTDPGLIIKGYPAPKGRRWLCAHERLQEGDRLDDADDFAASRPVASHQWGHSAMEPVIQDPTTDSPGYVLHYSRALGA